MDRAANDAADAFRRAEGDAFRRRTFTKRERVRIHNPRLASRDARDDGGDIHDEMRENDDAR